ALGLGLDPGVAPGVVGRGAAGEDPPLPPAGGMSCWTAPVPITGEAGAAPPAGAAGLGAAGAEAAGFVAAGVTEGASGLVAAARLWGRALPCACFLPGAG